MTETSLRQELESLILDTLLVLQRGDNRARMRKILFDIWNPRKSQAFVQAAQAFKDMAHTHTVIQGAQSEGRVFPWIYTPGAAAWFEGIYESALLLWLSIAPPRDPEEIAKPVRDFVAWQVGLFSAAIGAR